MKKYTITEEEETKIMDMVDGLVKEKERLKGEIKGLEKALALCVVSNRRELLIAFAEYMDSENDIFVPSWAVDNYINSNL